MEKTIIRSGLVLICIFVLFKGYTTGSDPDNGFDLENMLVPREEILQGGPPRDGIPALTNPGFENAGEYERLDDGDRVLGIFRNGIARAYPLNILNWHEIVNDRIGEEEIVITYCPLCYSGMAFIANVDGKHLTFGVSGLLYNSDVLLYDHQTESLWSQIMAKSISGKFAGTALEQIPIVNTTWIDWKNRYPKTQVLSLDTGYLRQYSRDPYDDYRTSEDLYFPVKFRSAGYHPKEPVIGIEIRNNSKAYPVSELSASPSIFSDELGTVKIYITYDVTNQTGIVMDEDCQLLPSVTMYWFAWYTFHPDTQVYKSGNDKNKSMIPACLD